MVGITGNPGSGKSTLADRLIQALRARGAKVAVVAVDPTSPFSGGAILGDRIRMQRHAADPGVFIRSLATRGALGGLSRSARDVVRVLDAWGADVVLVETVGVGQDELEITRTAHTTLVVMAPGMGDDVQAIKAGILECADVFAVNKADREGADATVRDLELMIALGGETFYGGAHWGAHVGGAARRRRGGAPSLRPLGASHSQDAWPPQRRRERPLGKLDAHRAWLESTEAGRTRRDERQLTEFRGLLRDVIARHAAGFAAPKRSRRWRRG